MRKRPPEPQFLVDWRKTRPTPQCCHTCDHYNSSGFCLKHQQEPPEEFAATLGACPDWEEDICPF